MEREDTGGGGGGLGGGGGPPFPSAGVLMGGLVDPLATEAGCLGLLWPLFPSAVVLTGGPGALLAAEDVAGS